MAPVTDGMIFRSSEFSDCGFPEEWMFAGVMISFMISWFALMLMWASNRKAPKSFWFVPLSFRASKLTPFGVQCRRVFLMSLVVYLGLSAALYVGFKYQVLTCGQIG